MPWCRGNKTPRFMIASEFGYPSGNTFLTISAHIGCLRILPVKTTRVCIFRSSRKIWNCLRVNGALSLIKIGKASQPVSQFSVSIGFKK